MNNMYGYFPLLIVHVKGVVCNTLDHASDSIHLNLTLAILIPTSSDGPYRQSRIYFTHAHLANSGYMVGVTPYEYHQSLINSSKRPKLS
jgi:hypothetical protein